MGQSPEILHAGTSINDWASALRKSGKKEILEFAQQIDEDRRIGIEGVIQLNLPRYKQETLRLEKFLEDPNPHFNALRSDQFYINLLPIKGSFQRYRQIDLTRKEVIDFIYEYIDQPNFSNYILMLSQYYENLFGGTLVVNPDERIHGELVRGTHAPLQSGQAKPEFVVSRNGITGRFEYNFLDPVLRQAVWDTIQTIPHEGDGRWQSFTPGYYEFALVKREQNRLMEPIFFDYRRNLAYLLPQALKL